MSGLNGPTYAEVRGHLRTGDVLLFSGKGAVSLGIKLGTQSRYSHVGMVVVDPTYDHVMLWESTTLAAKEVPDAVSGVARQGVQLVSLSARLQSYKGEVVVRYVEAPRDRERLDALAALRRELSGRPYETRKLSMISGAWGMDAEEDLSSVFCSELVAEAWQRLGWLDAGVPSDNFWPAHFSADRDGALPLREKVRMGPEIELKLI